MNFYVIFPPSTAILLLKILPFAMIIDSWQTIMYKSVASLETLLILLLFSKLFVFAGQLKQR